MNTERPTGPDPTTSDIEAESNLTRSQFLIWTGQKMSPGKPIYNMGWRFKLGRDVDLDRFAMAFDAIVASSDVLRMTVVDDSDTPMFRVGPDASGTLETCSVDGKTRDGIVEQLLSTPFDLERETFRSSLMHVENETWEWVFVQHHIVTDAASGAILLERLSEAYEALGAGEAPDAVAPAYADWAEIAAQAKNADDAAFWAEKLQRMPSPPKLSITEKPNRSARTTSLDVALGAARTDKLQAAIATDRFAALTPDQAQFNLIATALFAWLNRITGENNLVLGVTTHGRSTFAAKATAGLFMEILPLHVKTEPGSAVADLHAHVAENALELMMHASPGASSAASHAKFNVVLNYLRETQGSFAGSAIDTEWLDHGHFDPNHALWVDFLNFAGTDNPTLRLRMNATLFPQGSEERIAAQILNVLDAVLDDPDAAVADIAVADTADASVALTRLDPWTGASTPIDVCAAFAPHVATAPDEVVVIDDAVRMTRAELDSWSSAIAQSLIERGVGAGDRVGLYLTRGAGLVAAILGVLKAGAAYVPLDPLQPTERLRGIARGADLTLTLSEKSLAARWPDTDALVLIDGMRGADVALTARTVDMDADAYVIFTSGSTGTPKGVRISRRALARYVAFAAEAYADGAPATWALHSAIGFDLTVTSIFAPLITGGVIRAYRETPDSTDLSILKVFTDDAVDIVKLTPAHLSLVTRQQNRAQRIRTLILGGENLTTQLARTATDVLGAGLAIYNEYGPTEATVGCMIHRFDTETDTGPSVPIGRPADATAVYVLDAALKPAPDDVIGEIYVAGPDRLATGYLDLDAETQERFIPNPFAPQTLMYRTGDLAHVDGSGTIHYHGRNDDQIKIGSVRVELGEIRNIVLSYPQVTECFVTPAHSVPTLLQTCKTCGLGTDHPDADIDDTGECRFCRDYRAYRDKAEAYFRSMDDLRAILSSAPPSQGEYDCLMLLSGGKDSSYALGRLAALTPRVLAVTLDNGFLSEQAMTNIEKVCEALGVDHRFISTPYMNEIFADSLERHANVCNGCFKTIYTLGMQLAQKEGIRFVVTGLSRGQLFETRLAPELFADEGGSPDQIDSNIIEARRFYHRVPDAAAQRLNQGFFDDDSVFEKIQYLDFYRYCDVSVDEIYAYLDEKVPWLRPSDTGRSSNCLINDLGIYVHRKRRGYHNYALPYSWDVRMGHKTRDAALDELDDEIDEGRMQAIMQEIGYAPGTRDEPTDQGVSCYIVADGEVGSNELREHLGRHLPRAMVPASLHVVPEIPLTANGKVDRSALEKAARSLRSTAPASAQMPANETEAVLLDIWRTVLDRDDFGPQDNFFDFGGDSVHAISIASRASRAGLSVSALDILTKQTITSVATEIQKSAVPAKKTAPKRATLDQKSKDRLGALFGKKRDG